MSLQEHEIKELDELCKQITLKNFEIERLHDKVRMFIRYRALENDANISKAELMLRRGARHINRSKNFFQDFINNNTGAKDD